MSGKNEADLIKKYFVYKLAMRDIWVTGRWSKRYQIVYEKQFLQLVKSHLSWKVSRKPVCKNKLKSLDKSCPRVTFQRPQVPQVSREDMSEYSRILKNTQETLMDTYGVYCHSCCQVAYRQQCCETKDVFVQFLLFFYILCSASGPLWTPQCNIFPKVPDQFLWLVTCEKSQMGMRIKAHKEVI